MCVSHTSQPHNMYAFVCTVYTVYTVCIVCVCVVQQKTAVKKLENVKRDHMKRIDELQRKQVHIHTYMR